MTTFVSRVNDAGIFKIELQPDPSGVKVLVWETDSSTFPERDYLDDTLAEAKARCLEDYAVPADSWAVA